MRHLFPDDYTNNDLKQVIKSLHQTRRWKEIAEYELYRRKLNHQYTGHHININA